MVFPAKIASFNVARHLVHQHWAKITVPCPQRITKLLPWEIFLPPWDLTMKNGGLMGLKQQTSSSSSSSSSSSLYSWCYYLLMFSTVQIKYPQKITAFSCCNVINHYYMIRIYHADRHLESYRSRNFVGNDTMSS